MRGISRAVPTLLLLLAGCAAGGRGVAPAPRAAPWAAWIGRAGGLCEGPECARANAALARITAGNPSILVVRVLACDSLGAWTFSDGTIFVSRGLARSLSDDELAAVLAHETGHLRSAAALAGGAAFDGATASAEIEAHADDEGLAILRLRSIPPESLAAALIKVRNARSTSPIVRMLLDARIRRLKLRTAGTAPTAY